MFFSACYIISSGFKAHLMALFRKKYQYKCINVISIRKIVFLSPGNVNFFPNKINSHEYLRKIFDFPYMSSQFKEISLCQYTCP